MEEYYDELKSFVFFNFGGTSCKAKIVESKRDKKLSIGLFKESFFTNEKGEQEARKSRVYYTLNCAERLLAQLEGFIQEARAIEQGLHEILLN